MWFLCTEIGVSVMCKTQIWHQLAHTEVSLLSVRDTKNRHLSLISLHQNVNSLLWTSVQTGAQVSALFLTMPRMDAQEEYERVSPRCTKSGKGPLKIASFNPDQRCFN